MSTVSPSSFLVAEEGGCEEAVTPETSQFLKDVENFYSDVIVYVGLYNQRNGGILTPPQSLGTGSYLFGSPEAPIRMSLDLLNHDFENLQVFWEEIKGNKGTVKPIDDFGRRLNALLVKARRLQALSCQREVLSHRAEYDVRLFVQYQKEGRDPLELCQEIKEPSLCEMEQLMLERGGDSTSFKENYELPFKKKLEKFFGHKPKLSFQCFKDHLSERKKIIIPLSFDDRFLEKINHSFAVLNSIVASKWSNDKLHLVFIPYDSKIHSNPVEIRWSKNHLSYVKEDAPSIIYLSSFLEFNSLLTTLSHELGHTLGFPDCYHEFYDPQEKEIIYYSLDETGKNLMCHLDPMAKIPDSYLEKLSAALCE